MAPPTRSVRPGRTLAAFFAALVVLAGVMFLVDHSPAPKLGLDLQGGTSITLTARATAGSKVTSEAMNTAVAIIRQRVNGSGVAEAEVSTEGSNTIVVAVPGKKQDELVQLVGTTAELRFRPVLAVASGIPVPPVTSTPTPSGTTTTTPTPTGTTTSPSTSPTTSLVPSGSTTPAAAGARGSSVQTGLQALAASTATTTPSPTPSATDQPGAIPAAVQTAYDNLDCTDPKNIQGGGIDTPNAYIAACDKDGISKYLLAPADVLGTDIDNATAALPQGGLGDWEISLNFTGEGTKKFATATTALASQAPPLNQFAIVLDGVVQSAPGLNNGPILTGQASITGSFTQQEASQLANVLKYGALPLAFDTSDVTTVSPTLGSDYLRAGLIAGAIGLLLVIIYCLFYYRRLGIVVVASLGVAAILTYEAVVLLGAWVGFTLTLAGIAGLIVAVGITADSFVVYFERIRDEVREGRTPRAAVEHGWLRARRTIVSADFVSILASVVLYVVSVGSVKGFAFALGLSTVIDLVVVFFFTKPLVSAFAAGRLLGRGGHGSDLDAQHMGVQVSPTATGPSRTRKPRTTTSATREI